MNIRQGGWWQGKILVAILCAVAPTAGCRQDKSEADSETPVARAPSSAPRSLACFRQRLAPGDLKGWNLLLVTLDTTRADHLGCYGYGGVETPTLDGLSADGITFDHAVTPVPATLPAHCTILTGLEAPHHGVRTNGHFNLSDDKVTLAEVLREHDYATSAFVATYVLNHRFGASQGFDTYDDGFQHTGGDPKGRTIPRRADHQTDVAIAWLTAHLEADPGKPFFSWVHYFDPHRPYDPPGEFGKRYADAPYDGEIAFADAQFRRLLDFLSSRGLIDRTLIVVTADHGEGLFEHLEEDHSRLIYDTTVHVPLIISSPQLHGAACRVDDVTVGLIDIMPTVLSLLGVDHELKLDGLNLVTDIVPRDRVIYIESIAPLLYHGWASLHGVRSVGAKYIQAPIPEFYDLTKDPHELDNLMTSDTRVADEMATRLQKILSQWPSVEETARSTDRLSGRVAKNLAALGYVSTRGAEATDSPQRADPKDMVPIFDALRKKNPRALQDMSWQLLHAEDPDAGAYRRALVLAQAADKRLPGDESIRTTLAFALFRLERFAEAMETLGPQNITTATVGNSWPVYAQACRVMTLQRLGRTDQAGAALAALRTAMKNTSFNDAGLAQRLLLEATAGLPGG